MSHGQVTCLFCLWLSYDEMWNLCKLASWLVVSTPLKNMEVTWDHYSQYMESHKIHIPNHQPASIVPVDGAIYPPIWGDGHPIWSMIWPMSCQSGSIWHRPTFHHGICVVWGGIMTRLGMDVPENCHFRLGKIMMNIDEPMYLGVWSPKSCRKDLPVWWCFPHHSQASNVTIYFGGVLCPRWRLQWGYPQSSSISVGFSMKLNHPASGVPSDKHSQFAMEAMAIEIDGLPIKSMTISINFH